MAQKCPDCEMELYTLDDIEEITKRSDKTLRNEFQKIRQENKKIKEELEALKKENEELNKNQSEWFNFIQSVPEINPSNYDHDQVCEVNTKVLELYDWMKSILERPKEQKGE